MKTTAPPSKTAPAVRRDGRRSLRVWPWASALLSGVLLVFCLAPWNQEWLCWLALTPLIAAVWFLPDAPLPDQPDPTAPRWRRFRTRFTRWRLRRGVRCFFIGYLCGLVYIWGAFYWLTTVTIPGWVILGPYMACYPAVWSVFIGTLAWPGPVAASPAAAATQQSDRPGNGNLFI